MDENTQSAIRDLIRQISFLSEKAHLEGPRAQMREAAHQLLLASESPTDTVIRLLYQPQQNAVVKTAVELGIFHCLMRAATQARPVSAREIAVIAGAETTLVVRIMRMLVALGLCNQYDGDSYCANDKTETFSTGVGFDGVKSIYGLTAPTAAKLPEYLKRINYRNPDDSLEAPMKYACNLNQFEWMEQDPQRKTHFSSYMKSRRAGKPSWFEQYPVLERLVKGFQRDAGLKFMVDIGGGKGFNTMKFLTIYPDCGGMFVLQDLAGVVPTSLQGILTQAHDFLKPQPMRGARVYVLHSILHEFPDTTCRKILQHTAAAMKPGYSKLIICDLVLPDMGSSLLASSLDIQMMGLTSGMERSEAQWTKLLKSVGLKITGCWRGLLDEEATLEVMVAG